MTLRRRLLLVVSIAITLSLGVVAPRAWAWWRDTATVTSTITAMTLPPVPSTTCGVTGNSITGFTATIGWTVQTTPVAMSYTAKVREGSNLTVTKSGSAASVQVTSGLLGSLLGTTVHVDITAVLPGTAWTSVVHTRALNVGLAGLSLTCGADG